MLLLPHGYEGQGPDHSSARLERFLQLAAEINMRIANARRRRSISTCCGGRPRCSSTDPLPLVVLTPKSLLRHPLGRLDARASWPRARWQPVIDDVAGGRTRETRSTPC